MTAADTLSAAALLAAAALAALWHRRQVRAAVRAAECRGRAQAAAVPVRVAAVTVEHLTVRLTAEQRERVTREVMAEIERQAAMQREVDDALAGRFRRDLPVEAHDDRHNGNGTA